jgi:hypothetical protein
MEGAGKTLDPAGKQRIYQEVEAVFPREICWNFSGAFLPEPARIFRPGLSIYYHLINVYTDEYDSNHMNDLILSTIEI